ncbi:MAG: hypothetical protein RRA45_00390 [Saccharolobus sp.]|jgi:hypothetical protein|uniref:hypothetical protein n=1 Tax=Saccharolobus sp. TaxID=2100761 RepID=UPI0028CDF9CD|nr:hypothetical protein [Saccharolobus sp.]MDT7860669.1 hypothetical protein [Saccharolobus sp.]
MLGTVKDRTLEALLKYGDKAKYILKAAIDVYERNENKELGDFSYKQLIQRLEEMGVNYDPRMILRALEKDYGIIETTYKSANQHWWKFIDIEQTKLAVYGEDKNVDEPEISLIIIQYNSLNIKEIEKKLMFLIRKPKLFDIDRKNFAEFAFEILPLIVKLYYKASQYEETYEIAERLRKIISLAKRVSVRLNDEKGDNKGFYKKEIQGEDYNANSIRLSNSEDNI